MIAPRHSHKNSICLQSLLLNFQHSWYSCYLRHTVRFLSSNMVSARQASVDQDSAAKAPLPRSSSKSNLAKPPKAPKHSSSKEPLRALKRSTSASASTAPMTDDPRSTAMDITDNTADPSTTSPETSSPHTAPNPPESIATTTAAPVLCDNRTINTASLPMPTSPRTYAAVTATLTTPPHPSQTATTASPKTPPHHNKSPATRKNKVYFALQVMPSSLSSDQKATATQKLDAYRQGLTKVILALTQIDNTLALWPYENPNVVESDLLTKPDTLGSSIHQILQYLLLHPSDTTIL